MVLLPILVSLYLDSQTNLRLMDLSKTKQMRQSLFLAPCTIFSTTSQSYKTPVPVQCPTTSKAASGLTYSNLCSIWGCVIWSDPSQSAFHASLAVCAELIHLICGPRCLIYIFCQWQGLPVQLIHQDLVWELGVGQHGAWWLSGRREKHGYLGIDCWRFCCSIDPP